MDVLPMNINTTPETSRSCSVFPVIKVSAPESDNFDYSFLDSHKPPSQLLGSVPGSDCCDVPSPNSERSSSSATNSENGSAPSAAVRTKRTRRNGVDKIPLDKIVRSLTAPTGEYPQGITPSQLDEYIQKLPENQRITRSRNHLHVLLWRESKLGHITRLHTGRYAAPEYVSAAAQENSLKQHTKSLPEPVGARSLSENGGVLPEMEVVEALVNGKVAHASTSRSSFVGSTMVNGTTRQKVNRTNGQTVNRTNGTTAKTSPEKRPLRKRKADTSKDEDMEEEEGDEKKGNGKGSEKGGPRPKRKRTRKSLGPDFVTFDPATVVNGVEGEMCEVGNCLGPPVSKDALLLKCKECKLKAHPQCINYTEDAASRRIRCRSPWKCPQCKDCAVCARSATQSLEQLVICDQCDKGYHMQCHQPEVQAKPSGAWLCCQCEKEIINGKKWNGSINSVTDFSADDVAKLPPPLPLISPSNPTLQEPAVPALKVSGKSLDMPQLSTAVTKQPNGGHRPTKSNKTKQRLPPVVSKQQQLDTSKEGLSSTITDVATASQAELFQNAAKVVSSWSVEKVVRFFADVGFPEQSAAFKEQEIDGLSLLLLTRVDVLTRLAIRTGPALKIYERVRKLQQLFSTLSSA